MLGSEGHRKRLSADNKVLYLPNVYWLTKPLTLLIKCNIVQNTAVYKGFLQLQPALVVLVFKVYIS